MSNVQHIFKIAGAPATVPIEAGHHYVDTVSGAIYFSKGGSAVSDWVKVPTAKADLSLGNVDNTSDASKPVSTAQATAIALKADKTLTISTTSPLAGGGDLSANRTLSIAQADTSTSGYLSSTDWNTFNNKQPTSFTPTTPGDWTSVPASVQQALDNLAAAIVVSGIVRLIFSVSSTTTLGAVSLTDYVYFVSGTTTVTLPTAVGNTNRYTVKRVGSGVVTIATTSGQTIDGSASANLNVQYNSLDLVSDGSNWNVI
jgi:hypothetical protein